ncbi:hypothetical protein EIP86_008462 [Pleurotus ostreatoroseus]|nr:hypothetical protein EIP86_008462 [Pleurotus ostreatoroseus]
MAASRLYTLALEHKFTRGRRSMHVVAVCVYVACRQKETRNYMLIDFSDLLQVNVFELGHTYLQLVRTLNLRLPPIDPSHHISRFAALLEFGDETPKVAVDATRLVARMDRDWLARGRRPSGICGAALLLAARMNNFRRSVAEIVQVVKIADTTVRKRLEEFKKTGSAALSVGDFRSVWLEEESEPPAFVKGREKEEREREEREGGGEASKGKGKTKGKKKGKGKKRKRGEDSEDEEDAQSGEEVEGQVGESSSLHARPVIDPALLNEGILAGTAAEPLFLPEEPDTDPLLAGRRHIDQAPDVETGQTIGDISPPTASSSTLPVAPSPIEASLDEALTQEVSSFLETAQGAELSGALDDAESRRVAAIEENEELAGLDEEELDAFILTEEEVKMKERVWVEMNREYLENLAAKAELEQLGGEPEKKKRKVRALHMANFRSAHLTDASLQQKRKTTNKPRDASTPHGATAAESVRNLIKKNPRYSKRINYEALRDLFDGAGPANIDMEEKLDADEGLWRLDPDKEDEDMGGVVIEESGGGVGQRPTPKPSTPGAGDALDATGDAEMVGELDDAYADGSDKGDDYAVEDWDAYEQEV